MSIGVGIIGGGIFAREEHLPAVEASKHLTFKAVYSRSATSAKTLLEGGRQADVYSDDSGEGKGLKDLLARQDIHAVIIALPILNQPDYVRAALEAGKHVLSEKPIAENMKDALELVRWYESSIDSSKVTWGVAENFRYLNSFDAAKAEVEKLGRVLTFRCRMQTKITGGEYLATPWRKNPTHQGGFLLDGGVHFVAGIRQLLGPDYITRMSAYTAQLQSHLPPVDTAEGSAKTKSGGIGNFSLSFGTTVNGSEYTVACERGSVSVSGTTVKTKIDGKEDSRVVEDEATGVPPEIRAWGEALAAGRAEKKQSPREALADLELLENLLVSNGAPIDCVHQAL